MEAERRFVPVAAELRAEERADGGSGITGTAALFDSVTDIGPFEEVIERGAFDDAVKSSDVRALFNHDPNFVLGRTSSGTLDLRETDKGLEYVVASLPESRGDVREAIERGDVDGNSFSFTVDTEVWEERGEDEKPLRRITRVAQLFDVGPVTFPAYQDTEVSLRAKQHAEELVKRRDPQEQNRRKLELLRRA